MKKLISAAALLAAGTALSSAATVSLLPEATTVTKLLAGGTTATSLGGWDGSAVLSVSATDVNSQLSNQSGWILGCGTKNDTLPEKDSFSVSYDDSAASATFTLTGRPAYHGVFAALVVDLGSVLTENTLESLNVSFSVSVSTTTAGTFSAWTVSDGSASSLISEVALSGVSGECSESIADLSLTSSDKVVFLFNTQGLGGGTTFTVSGFEAVATVSAIPEPSAFGLLAGAGALALVASRRRRNKR